MYNLDRKGKPKAYGQCHLTKASAKKHLRNLKKYYKGEGKPKDLLGTLIVNIVGERHRGLSSNQIIKRYFRKD